MARKRDNDFEVEFDSAETGEIDWKHTMVVPGMCDCSASLQHMELEYFADKTNLLPMPFRNEDGTLQRLDPRELREMAALGFTENEWRIMRGYEPLPEETK